MEDHDQIIDLKRYPYYPLRGHENYFNWIDTNFNDIVAKQMIEEKKCPRQCEKIKECEFCSFDGGWRSLAEPNLFFDNENDTANNEGILHWFVVSNAEMAFLEAFTGEHEKAEDRLQYLNGAIENSADQHVEYSSGYNYICQTLEAFVKFCKTSLERSDLDALQKFKNLDSKAQIGVMSIKYLFYKEKKDTFNIQVRILRKVSSKLM